MLPRRAVLVVTVVVLAVGVPNVAAPTVTPDSGSPAAESASIESGPPMPQPASADATTETTTASETATAAGSMTTTPANDTLPPGLNQSGVEDRSALVTAHRNSLNETGFAFRFQSNVSVGPASQWTAQRGTVEAGLSPLVVSSTSVRQLDGDTTTFATDIWANDSAVVVQHSRENRTELRQYNRTGGNLGVYDESWAHLPRADLESQVTLSWLLDLTLTVGEFDLDRTETRDGHRVAVLRATEPVAAANYTDLNATLVVDSEGRVHSLSLTATAEDTADTRIHYDFELTEVGSVAVERPQWVEAATPPNATTTANTTTTADREETAAANEMTTTTTD